MISIAIISIGIVAITQTFATILNVLAISQNTIKSTLLLEEKIEELEELNRTENLLEGSSEGVFKEENSYKWNYNISQNEENENLSSLNLVVLWEEGRRKGEIALNTYLLNLEKEEE